MMDGGEWQDSGGGGQEFEVQHVLLEDWLALAFLIWVALCLLLYSFISVTGYLLQTPWGKEDLF